MSGYSENRQIPLLCEHLFRFGQPCVERRESL